MDKNNLHKFYNVKELAQLLGVSKSLIYDLIYKEKIPAMRIGRRILIPHAYVEQLVES